MVHILSKMFCRYVPFIFDFAIPPAAKSNSYTVTSNPFSTNSKAEVKPDIPAPY